MNTIFKFTRKFSTVGFHERIKSHGKVNGGRLFLVGKDENISYKLLSEKVNELAVVLLSKSSIGKAKERKAIAFIMKPSLSYVLTMLAVWRIGGIAVPLSPLYPEADLQYFVEKSDSFLVLHDSKEVSYDSLKNTPCLSMESLLKSEKENTSEQFALSPLNPGNEALIMFTSGTTGKPKAVVHTMDSLINQVHTLADAWKWTSDDRILHILPLHHTHGIVNGLLCAIWAGASVEFWDPKDTELLWRKLSSDINLTVFMAVPTIYARLIKYHESLPANKVDEKGLARLRLVVSGSAALNPVLFDAWKKISGGYPLLERYGMTEIGMALSNPYDGERLPGTVGFPLAGVQAKIDGVPDNNAGGPGELLIKSKSMFKEYYGDAGETAKSFDSEGWFRTGDFVTRDKNGRYAIVGRSVDIIKSGGYKISALEIENIVMQHPLVKDCAVAGTPDPEWGERVTAFVVINNPSDSNNVLTLDDLRLFCRSKLVSYKIPSKLIVLLPMDQLPRNLMGKINKKLLLQKYLDE